MYIPQEPNLVIALGLVVLTLAINVPLFLLIRRQYREKSPVSIVKRHPLFPAFGVGGATLCFLVFLAAIYAYMTDVASIDVVVPIVIGPVVTTLLSMYGVATSRWRVLIFDDYLVYKQWARQPKTVLLAGIDKVRIIEEIESIDIFSDGKKVAAISNCTNFHNFHEWIKSTNVEIEYMRMPEWTYASKRFRGLVD